MGTPSSFITLILALAIGLSAALGVATFQQEASDAKEAELAVTRLRVVLDQFERIGTIIRANPDVATEYMGQFGSYATDAQALLATIGEVAPGPEYEQLQTTFEALIDTLVRIRVLIAVSSENLASYIEEMGVPARVAFEQELTEADAAFHEKAETQQRFATYGMWSVLILAAVGTSGFAVVNERLRRKTTLMLMGQEAHFRSLVQYGADLISVLDPDFTVRFQSPSILPMLGFEPESVERKPFADIVHSADLKQLDQLLAESAVKPETAVTGELRMVTAEGHIRTVEVIVNNLIANPDVRGFVLTSRDVTERIQEAEFIAFQAMHDDLTQLPNRRLFMDRLSQGISRSVRAETSIAVVFLDLNDFKEVNDQYGHDAGDTVLRVSAQRIQQSIRQGDTAARLGGDEFVVMLEVKSGDEAQLIADRLVRTMHKPIFIDPQMVQISISLGVAVHQIDEDPEELLRRADLAMYSGKHAGISEAVMFDASMEPTRAREQVSIGA